MKISLLTESAPNPVLGAVLEALGQQHSVSVDDPQTLSRTLLPGRRSAPADVVLLKSRSPQARAVARTAERVGSVVVNRPEATAATLDRRVTADALRRAAVPAPRTWYFPRLRQLTVEDGRRLPWPLVVKSRTSSRGDLVRLVHSREDLADLLPQWGDEPVVAQEFAANDGFDVKVWVIGDDLSAALRRSALESVDKSSDVLLDPADMPPAWTLTARRAGAALGLDLFGVDLLITEGRPVVVDVNAFPGFRGARNPAESLLRFLAGLTTARLVTA